MSRHRGDRGGRRPLHGARALSKAIEANQLDGRTKIARMLAEVQADLTEDAGGPAHVTNREKILIERAAAMTLVCSAFESYLLDNGAIDAAGNVAGCLHHYGSYANSLSRILQALGLRPDRRQPELDLATYIRLRDAESAAAAAHRAAAPGGEHAELCIDAPGAAEDLDIPGDGDRPAGTDPAPDGSPPDPPAADTDDDGGGDR